MALCCETRVTQDRIGPSYHLCSLNEGHDGDHGCICGARWQREGHPPELTRPAFSPDSEYIVRDEQGYV